MKKITSDILSALLCAAAVMGAGSVCQAAEAAEQPDIIVSDERSQQETNIIGTDGGSQAAEDFTFADVADYRFWFSSGVGAWGTELTIHEDGSFEGSYHDSDMGDTGEGYPGGTMYLCDFTGSFTEPEKVNDYTYSFRLGNLEYDRDPETEEIKNEIRYVYSIPYGMDGAEEFWLYLPGAPLEELPEEFLRWVGYYDLTATEDTELPFYGLYNVQEKYGFSGYEPAQEETADERLSSVEAEAKALNDRMETENLTQSELGELSAQLYQLWDDKLNELWGELKETLDEEAMNQLVDEELAWIDDKEARMQDAAAQYEGGSLSEMARYTTGAELTRERAYVLAGMLQ